MKKSLLSNFLILIFVYCFFTQILAIKKSYIVYLGSHVHGSDPTSIDIARAKNSHYNLLGSFLGSTKKAKESIFVQYTENINGFGAMLEEKEATEIAKHPNVVSVFLNKKSKLHTTRSWDFLGLVEPGNSIWEKARFGEDVIIANIDTGVWPESKSFSDKGYGPIPSRWKGICQQDETDTPVRCNRKLIGARYFTKGTFTALETARDDDGHGTHTLSTAAGNFVTGVSVDNQGNGTAKGGAPKAHVAAYKVCFLGEGCQDANVLAAFDAAISDGVDVISMSLGLGDSTKLLDDAASIGSFHALIKNISVICSAGNGGPNEASVSNDSPWIFTVAASTIDRNLNIHEFKDAMDSMTQKVRAPVMGNFSSRGPSVYQPSILKPDITAPGVKIIAAFSEEKQYYVGGKPTPFRVETGTSMSCPHVAGIVGLLKSLYPSWSPAAIRSAIMTTATTKDNFNAPIKDYDNTEATPFAFGAGHVQPNIAADPGLVYDLTINDYLDLLCAVGFTASKIKPIYGRPYKCPESSSIASFNYPTISVADLKGTVEITRRLKNVGPPGTYKVAVEAPEGVLVSVSPRTLEFSTGEEKSFSVRLTSTSKRSEDDGSVFGSLVWSDGKHYVRSPLAVVATPTPA